MRGYAYYQAQVDSPPGGVCLSAFAVLRRGDAFLALQPRAHEAWKDWAPNWDIYAPEQLAKQWQLWRLPAAYLREGDHPDDTARRVVEGQLGATVRRLEGPRIVRFHEPSARFPGTMHWDLCFVYEADAEPAPLAQLPWLSALRWFRPEELRDADFGSSIGDLAKALGLAR